MKAYELHQEETELRSLLPQKFDGWQLQDYLCARFRYQSREDWQELIARAKVTVNGDPSKADQVLKKGDLICYRVVLKEPPVNTDIRIIFEDEDLLVVEKPAHLPSHGDGNFIKNTLIYLLNQRLSKQGFSGTLHLAHRLDRETSGLMVLAKNKPTLQSLMQQFSEGKVKKIYQGLVKGESLPETGEINAWIGIDKKSMISIKRAALPANTQDAKPACTAYKVLRRLRGAMLLEIQPKTGRTNQIRVHLASLGHPILGDKLYGKTDEEYLAYVQHLRQGGDAAYQGHAETSRQMLHAGELSFFHPKTAQALSFKTSLPSDFTAYIQEHS